MSEEQQLVDWEGIETAYRLGKPTIRKLADLHGVNPSTITRRAKAEGWTRDLSERVRQETKARVSAQVVEAAHKAHTTRIHAHAHAVEVEAISNALMIAEHEKAGTKGRELFASILDRIAEQVNDTASVEQLIQMVHEQDPESVRALAKVMALPSYADTAKKAIEGAAKAIDIERKARNLDEPDDDRSDVIEHIRLVSLRKPGTD